MAKNPTTRDFVQQSAESTMHASIHGMDWMRGVAEQSLNLSKAAFEGYLTTARKTAESINNQASEMQERSLSLASEALSHTFDFANMVVRVKEPREVLQLQSEFLSRQAQTLADQAKELGQMMVQSATAASRSAEPVRRAAE
jgi:hypothetical protein